MEEADFDRWNEIKKLVERAEQPALYPQEREVWMCTIGRNIGFEQNGSGHGFGRPVLVVRKFNNQMFWTAPLSSKQKPFDFYHNFTDPHGERVSVILAQLRLMSVKRFDRKMYDLAADEFGTILGKLRGFL
jgi:hypothetical protein